MPPIMTAMSTTFFCALLLNIDRLSEETNRPLFVWLNGLALLFAFIKFDKIQKILRPKTSYCS